MAKTLAQIQAMITGNGDPRQILNELADYLETLTSTDSVGSLEELLALGNDAGELTIENLANPTTDQQAATKKYVDDKTITGTSAAMQAGTVTVNTTAVTAQSKIFLSHATPIGTLGWLSPGTIVPGVSFVINSTGATDLSTVNWLIIN